MIIKKTKKTSPVIYIAIGLFVLWFGIKLSTFMQLNDNKMSFNVLNDASDSIFHIQPVIFNQKSLAVAFFLCAFSLVIAYSFLSGNKKNIQEDTYGSAEWADFNDIKKYLDPNPCHNQIFSKHVQIAMDMTISNRSRHTLLVGNPGTGKSRYYYKPNIINAYGSIVVTDPKGELLRDTAHSLITKGYDIRSLNLDEKWLSDGYNPFHYIRKLPKEAYDILDQDGTPKDINSIQDMFEHNYAEDDVMTLINTIIQNTKSDAIQQQTGDPFWEKAEMIFDQACFFYTMQLPEEERTIETVLNLMRKAIAKGDGDSELDKLFKAWELKEPDHIGVRQYNFFKTARGNMVNTIVMCAVARLASVFEIAQVRRMTKRDELEFDRLGKPGKEGKIAIFIVTKPGDSTYNCIANIAYTQMFNILDTSAKQFDGYLPTPVNMYMDEWAQLGEIPRFLENLAYVRSLNVGISIGIQSFAHLKKVYDKHWEAVLDCVENILFLGANSHESLKYISDMLDKKTWYKRSSSRQFGRNGHSSHSDDVVGRELATVGELFLMEKNHAIILMKGEKPFFDELYELNKHPRYDTLYENRNPIKTKRNRHNHAEYMKENRKKIYFKQQLKLMGIKGTPIILEQKDFYPSEIKKFQIVGNEETFINEIDQ